MSYSAAVLADSPLGYWRQGEASGTVMGDASGNARPGTYSGSDLLLAQLGLVPGAGADTAAYYTGNARGLVAYAAWMDTASFTVSAWVKVTSASLSGVQTVVGRREGADNWQFRLNAGKPEALVWRSSGLTTTTAPAALVAGNTYFLALVATPTETIIYVDGVQVVSATVASSALVTASGALHIGWYGSTWEGLQQTTIDEAALFGAALTNLQIQAHYAAGRPGGLTLDGILPTPTPSFTLDVALRLAGDRLVGTRRRYARGYLAIDYPTAPVVTATPVTARSWDVAAVTATLIDGRPPLPGVIPTLTEATGTGLRRRIIVGGRDLSTWRDGASTITYTLTDPYDYGTGTVRVVGLQPIFESSPLPRWTNPKRRVRVDLLNPDGTTHTRGHYRGWVLSRRREAGVVVLEVVGELSGRAANDVQPPPVVRRVKDAGTHIFGALRSMGLRVTPRLGPTTGQLVTSRSGGQKLAYLDELLALATGEDGVPWTIRRTSTGAWEMVQVDQTTVQYTAWVDEGFVSLTDAEDASAAPDRWYGRSVAPDGRRVKNAVFPHARTTTPPPYPMAGGVAFGTGTTDSATIGGDGITLLHNKLMGAGYLTRRQAIGTYDAQTVAAVKRLQEDAGLTETGAMTTAAWDALYDTGVTGFSTRGAKILPMVEKSRFRAWNRSPSGAILGRNPAYDADAIAIGVLKDAGPGVDRPALMAHLRAERARTSGPNLIGSLAVQGGLWAGDHTHGTAGTVTPPQALKPGNIRLANIDGGVLVHAAYVTHPEDEATAVTIGIDTQWRNAPALATLMQRDAEARANPALRWLREHRSSGLVKDRTVEWDEYGGELDEPWTLPANAWTVVPVVAGESGTVQILDLTLTPVAEFAVAVFARRVRGRALDRLIGDPFVNDADGDPKWMRTALQDKLRREWLCVYVAGTLAQPCGYWPKKRTNAAGNVTSAPLTGRWRVDDGFDYHTGYGSAGEPGEPVLWMAIRPRVAAKISPGRVMWPTVDEGG